MNVNDKNLFFLQLPPPGSEGDKFDKLATNAHGVPIGETDGKNILALQLGYSDKDSIGSSLDEVNDLAGQLNIILANPKYASVDYVVVFYNQIDPKNPKLPPINSLLTLSTEMLKQGNIGGTQVTRNEVENEVEIEENNAETSTTKTSTNQEENLSDKLGNVPVPGENNVDDEEAISSFIKHGLEASDHINTLMADIQVSRAAGIGNAWLSGNAYVAFLNAFAEMQNVLMRNKVVQGKIEVASLGMIYTMAKHTADLIMEVASRNKEIHMAQAVMAGLSIGLTIVMFGGMAKAKDMKFAADQLTMITNISSQIEKMVTSAIQADRDLPIARLESQKELVQAARTIVQRLMEKTGEAFRSDTDRIAQLLQLLDKIRESLHQSIAASLRK